MSAAIEAEALRKVFRTPLKRPGLGGALAALFRPNYQEKVAVADVSFTIAPGEVVGYIGVNGAGKSTTIKLLTGILQPSGGRVRVLGRDPQRERVANARRIGVIFGQRTQLWWDLALIESLTAIGRMYEVPTTVFRERLDRFCAELDLGELLHAPIRSMSLGQKMRAELAATLIHAPDVVYLDEPTIGLDLIVKERIRAFIKAENRARGTTVLLTTHDLGDIEELCTRVLIIDGGRLIYDGPLSAIRDRFGAFRQIAFETAAPLGDLALPPGVEVIEQAERRVALRFDRRVISASQVTGAVMAQAEVADFTVTEPDLASVVRQIYNGALAEQ